MQLARRDIESEVDDLRRGNTHLPGASATEGEGGLAASEGKKTKGVITRRARQIRGEMTGGVANLGQESG